MPPSFYMKPLGEKSNHRGYRGRIYLKNFVNFLVSTNQREFTLKRIHGEKEKIRIMV